MPHVPPHRWAELDAGHPGDRQRAAAEAHVESCSRCAAQRERVRAVRAAFEPIRTACPPDPLWDQIGARVYWVTSSERRARQRLPEPTAWRSVGLAAVSAVVLAVGTMVGAHALWGDGDRAARSPGSADPAPARDPIDDSNLELVEVSLAPEPILGVATLVKGDVRVNGEQLAFDDPIRAGLVVSTTAGRVAVQFGPNSGFELGPDTTMRVRSFDRSAIELEVSGEIDVDIERRDPAQRFAVIAGDHTVEVRGTAFRVAHRDETLEVACARGRVVVSDGVRPIGLDAGNRLLVALRQMAVVRELPRTEHLELERSIAMPMLPEWTEPVHLYAHSATLAVRARPEHTVTVNGAPIADGAFLLRVTPGRHRVAGRWTELSAGASARIAVAQPESQAGDRRVRRLQLVQALTRHPRIDQCLTPLAKLDLIDGSFIVFDIGIHANGSQGHLNIVDSNLPPDVQRCLRRVVDRVELADGPKVEFRYKLAF